MPSASIHEPGCGGYRCDEYHCAEIQKRAEERFRPALEVWRRRTARKPSLRLPGYDVEDVAASVPSEGEQ